MAAVIHGSSGLLPWRTCGQQRLLMRFLRTVTGIGLGIQELFSWSKITSMMTPTSFVIGKHLVNSLSHTQNNDCNPLALDPNTPSLENVNDLVCSNLLGMAFVHGASAFLHRRSRL